MSSGRELDVGEAGLQWSQFIIHSARYECFTTSKT